MSILLTRSQAHDVAKIWVESARGINKGYLNQCMTGGAVKILTLFINWLERHGIWLMTNCDKLGQSLWELEEELKNIRRNK